MNMLKKYNNTLLGSYFPSFFIMNLCTNEKLNNLDNLSEKTKSILYHEYVHFMQDLTTTFGLTNIISNVDIQKAINKKIIESENTTFKTPVSFDEYYNVEAYANLNLMFLGDAISNFTENSFITSIDLVSNGAITDFEDKPYVEIKFTTNGVHDSFAFGAITIMENMAYLIEKNLYDNVNPPFFPYKVVERVIAYLNPNITQDIDIIMLCDYALNTPDPGRFLIDFLKITQDHNCTNYQEFYQILRTYKFESLSNEKYTIYTLFEERSEFAKQQLKDYFTAHEFKDNNLWIDKILTSTSLHRLVEFNFWAKILSLPTKEQRRSAFNEMIAIFGFPLMSNNNMEISFSHPEVAPKYISLFQAISEVNEILSDRQTDCRLQKFCRQEKINMINENCKTPWIKGTEDPLCPFGQIIKMWGIHEKTPSNN